MNNLMLELSDQRITKSIQCYPLMFYIACHVHYLINFDKFLFDFFITTKRIDFVYSLGVVVNSKKATLLFSLPCSSQPPSLPPLSLSVSAKT